MAALDKADIARALREIGALLQIKGENPFKARAYDRGAEAVEGIADFDYYSEQYYLHYDPSIDILATTLFTGEHDPVTTGIKMPVVFKRQFGAGRVFYSALGHVVAEFANPQMRTILRRGLNWAAR